MSKRVNSWYRDKRKLRVITLAKGLRLPFEARLAYSYLVKVARGGRGVSKRLLAERTGLDRTRTVPAALAELERAGLVERRDRRYHAREAPPGQVVYTKGRPEDPWFKRLAYFTLVMPAPACPLTLKQAAVFFLLHSDNVRFPVRSRLASLLRISRTTVIAALKKLRTLGLLDGQDGPVAPTEQTLAWWQGLPPTAAVGAGHWGDFRGRMGSLVKYLDDAFPEHSWGEKVQEIGRRCEAAKYPYAATFRLIQQTGARLAKALPLGNFVLALARTVQEAEEATRRNRTAGTFLRNSSFGLFKAKVKDLEEGLRRKFKG